MAIKASFQYIAAQLSSDLLTDFSITSNESEAEQTEGVDVVQSLHSCYAVINGFLF